MTTPDSDPAAPAPAASPPPPDSPRWTTGRVVGMILSSLTGLVGLAMLIGGLAVIAVHAFVRDDDGYLSSGEERLRAAGYAISTDDIDLGAPPADWTPVELLGTVRIKAEDSNGAPVFIGIAPRADLQRYLSGVGRAELTDFVHGDPRYDVHPGGAPPNPPGAEDFWAAETAGPGEQRLDWESEEGTWAAVVMNADARRGVSVDAEVGAELDWLIWAGIGLAVFGLVLSVTAVILILAIGRRRSRAPPAH